VSDGPVAQPSTWNIANALTVLRVLLVPLFGWFLLKDGGDDFAMRIAAFVTFGVAALTDKFDGDLARSRGLVTDFGKIADPIADKALMGMALIGLSILGEVSWWVTIVILVREIGITLMRFWVIRYGVIAASYGGKLKTIAQIFAIGLFLLPLPAGFDPLNWAVMWVALALTVGTGVDYVVRALRLRAGG
jgi:CDP-diacylglycerol---glycerol-3-phosphate 3-phosphatidyltransferase